MKPHALLLSLLVAGCSSYYGKRPECPLPEMTKLAVLPVRGAPQGEEDRFGEILASELIQFPGIDRVVRPRETRYMLTARGFDRNEVKDLRAPHGPPGGAPSVLQEPE